MHIIIDATTTQDQLAYAGVGQYTKNIILSLIKQYPENTYSILLFNNKESTLGDLSKYKNVEVIDIGEYKINDYKNNIWYYTKILPIIKKIKKENSIYFCPYFWRNYPSNIMPTVLFVHDMNLPIFNMYSQQSPIHNFIRKIQYWKTLNKSLECKRIICNSETTKNDYLKYYPQYPEGSISVSYLGVNLEGKEVSLDRVLPNDYKERKYLIYLGGGINKSKNSDGVIRGYIEFVKKVGKEKAPYLVIAGGKFKDRNQKEVQELYQIVEENGVEDLVLFTGFYEDIQKYSLLTNAFASIHLALYEGFGIAPLESLRCRTLSILHRSPVYEELFSDTAVLVDGLNPEEVGENILDVYSNPEKYSELIERGHKISFEYTWEKAASITNRVFEKTVGKVK